jgi:hypothetical protein
MALLIKKFQLSGTSRFCVPVIIGKHFTDFCFLFYFGFFDCFFSICVLYAILIFKKRIEKKMMGLSIQIVLVMIFRK